MKSSRLSSSYLLHNYSHDYYKYSTTTAQLRLVVGAEGRAVFRQARKRVDVSFCRTLPLYILRGHAVQSIPAGNLFCFLQLPIKTGMAVHLNSFFELSSNRRHLAEEGLDRWSWGFGIWVQKFGLFGFMLRAEG